MILVAKPEKATLVEAARASLELSQLGMTNQQLIINGLLQTTGEDHTAAIYKKQQTEALSELPRELNQLPCLVVPLLPVLPLGIPGLRLLGNQMAPAGKEKPMPPIVTENTAVSGNTSVELPTGLTSIIDYLSGHESGVILVMGKGGVDKTTVAAALALALTERGHKVHLSTTDPAAHLHLTLDGAGKRAGDRFSLSRIDPQVEVAAYREQVMATVGEGMDEDARALLVEDLASPCTEEIAVFRGFARTVDRIKEGFVVLDTAPTGHTLLLLDSTESYHRQVQQSTGDLPEEVRQLLPRLRNPEVTHVLLVTLAQATPVLEASRLQEDLRRAGIEPQWWIINQTWTGVATNDPVLSNLAKQERVWIDKIKNDLARRAVRISWLAETPRGWSGLKQLFSL